MVGAPDDPPGVRVRVDEPAPGQRLVGDPQAAPVAPGRPARATARRRGRRRRRRPATPTSRPASSSAPSCSSTSNLRSARRRLAAKHVGRDRLEVAERLVEVDRQASAGALLPDPARRPRRRDEVAARRSRPRGSRPRRRRPACPRACRTGRRSRWPGVDSCRLVVRPVAASRSAMIICPCLLSVVYARSSKCRSIRSASGSTPVKSRNASTAWKTTIRPPSRTRQPRARAAAEQFRLQRAVDDVGDPEVGPQQLDGQRQTGVGRHAGGRGVGQPVGVAQRVRQRPPRHRGGPAGAEAVAHADRPAPRCAPGRCRRSAAPPRPATAGRARRPTPAPPAPSSTTRSRAASGRPGGEAAGEAGQVGVVADRPAVGEHDRVDRAERGRVGGERVEVSDDELLGRMGDVDAVVAGQPRRGQDVADRGGRQARAGRGRAGGTGSGSRARRPRARAGPGSTTGRCRCRSGRPGPDGGQVLRHRVTSRKLGVERRGDAATPGAGTHAGRASRHQRPERASGRTGCDPWRTRCRRGRATGSTRRRASARRSTPRRRGPAW